MTSDEPHADEPERQFFERLEKLFTQRKGSDHGKVYLMQKRLLQTEDAAMPSASDPYPDLNPSEPQSILIRATNGKSKRERADKVSFTTIVKPDDLEGFYTRYADVCKTGMTALKPRDRSKKKAKAKKKKAGS